MKRLEAIQSHGLHHRASLYQALAQTWVGAHARIVQRGESPIIHAVGFLQVVLRRAKREWVRSCVHQPEHSGGVFFWE